MFNTVGSGGGIAALSGGSGGGISAEMMRPNSSRDHTP